MNIGDTIYSSVQGNPCYEVDVLRDGVAKRVIDKILADDLEDNFGFDDAVNDMPLMIKKAQLLGQIIEKIVDNGEEYAVVDLPCVWFDDGHDGFIFGGTASQNRKFTVRVAFLARTVTNIKPQDFTDTPVGKEENDKIGGSGASGVPEVKKTNTGLIVGLSALILAIIAGTIYFFNRD